MAIIRSVSVSLLIFSILSSATVLPTYVPSTPSCATDFALQARLLKPHSLTASNPTAAFFNANSSWHLTTYEVTNCQHYMVLANVGNPNALSNSTTSAQVFYVNGTLDEVQAGHPHVLTVGQLPPRPLGITVPVPTTQDDQASEIERAVSVTCGQGTDGIGISALGQMDSYFASMDPKLQFEQDGVWYACSRDLSYGPALQLFYRSAAETTPRDCAEVELVPRCVGGNFGGVQFVHPHNSWITTVGCIAAESDGETFRCRN